jgi:hypothetical protein
MKGHWFKFVLYKKGAGGVEAKLTEFWALDINRAVKRVRRENPDYQQWFIVQTGWWKALASLLMGSHIIKFKK